MKKFITSLLIILFLLSTNVFAQSNPDYSQKMYYLCKVWGYLKYFHSEVAKGTQSWDSVLISSISEAENAVTKEDFNSVLLSMINKAGPMAIPTTPAPEIEDSLKINLNLEWFGDQLLSTAVKEQLDTINSRFREQDNFYIFSGGAGNPYLVRDSAFRASGMYPEKGIRLDALFRYWNIINYFYPYKYQMDQNWDSTLVEFIPKIANATNNMEYHFGILELATHLNDSHAFTSSSILSSQEGSYYPPFNIQYVDNETVITKVFEGNQLIRVGDVIKEIDAVDILVLRDSLHKYTIGSNEATINRNINSSILSGESGLTRMKVENTDGTREVNFSRYLSSGEFYSLAEPQGPIWKIIEGTNIGYVDMGRLLPDSVSSMFNELWNTRGIIFDIRNYPQGSIYDILDYLTTTPIYFVKFTIPYINYPGSVTWMDFSLGGDNPQPELYNGSITILFNEETQSHAEFTCMALDYFDQTYKIGSQTAGADGNVSSMYLPGGITTYFTGLGVFYPDGRETQRVGIIPDLEVHPTINGIREGRDEVLDAAIRRITDVEEITNIENQINIYPNPSQDYIYVKFEESLTNFTNNLSIYNIFGEQRMNIGVQYNKPVRIDISYLPVGIYFIRFGDKSKMFVKD